MRLIIIPNIRRCIDVAFATRSEAIATTMVQVAIRLEAIAIGLEAIDVALKSSLHPCFPIIVPHLHGSGAQR